MAENKNFTDFLSGFKKSSEIQTTEDEIEKEMQKKIERLKLTPEVQKIADEIDFANAQSILNFGKNVSDEIDKVSEEIVAITQRTTDKDIVKMLTAFGGLVKKFDLKEYDLRKIEPKNAVMRVIKRSWDKVKTSLGSVVEKFGGLSSEIDTIVLQMKKYELDIKTNDEALQKLYSINETYIDKIEKYIAAAELAKERIEEAKESVLNTDDPDTTTEEKNLMLDRLEKAGQQLTEQTYVLYVNKSVALQNIPAINHVHDNNFNLSKNVNMASRTLIPTLRQQLVIGQSLQQQDIQNKVNNELKEITEKMMKKNANYNAKISTEIRKSSSASTISVETLKECQSAIETAIINSQHLAAEIEAKRLSDIKGLKDLEARTKDSRNKLNNVEKKMLGI